MKILLVQHNRKTEFSAKTDKMAALKYNKRRIEVLRKYGTDTGILTIYPVPPQTRKTLDALYHSW